MSLTFRRSITWCYNMMASQGADLWCHPWLVQRNIPTKGTCPSFCLLGHTCTNASTLLRVIVENLILSHNTLHNLHCCLKLISLEGCLDLPRNMLTVFHSLCQEECRSQLGEGHSAAMTDTPRRNTSTPAQSLNVRTSLMTASHRPSSIHGFTMASAAWMGYVLLEAYHPASSGSGPRGGPVAAVLNVRVVYLLSSRTRTLSHHWCVSY